MFVDSADSGPISSSGFDPELNYEPQDARWRKTELTKETVQLYEAMSFLTWRYGQYFNTHVTLSGNVMGLADHRWFSELLPIWNKEVARWLAVSNETPRRRWCKRARAAVPQQHLWMYVIERGREKGIHAHQLCIVPPEQLKAFKEHARNWWARQIHWDMDPAAIEIRSYRTAVPNNQRLRQVEWFRYLIKSTRRDQGLVDEWGAFHSFEKIFKLAPYWTTAPVYAHRLYGVCRALQPAARQAFIEVGSGREHFCSMLTQERFTEVYSGWEYEAWQQRQNRLLLANLHI